MTREEIMNMPAGREMDKIIAEKVFGLEIRETEKWVKSCVPSKLRQPDYKVSIISAGGLPLKNYSTDILAAWCLIDKMHEKEYQYTLRGYFMGGEQHVATFDNQDWADKNPLYRAHGATATLAICRAALLTTLED